MRMNDLLLEQIKAIIDKDLPLVSNLANVSAILNKLDNINWCGFYLLRDDVLYLGPFQGEVACSKIPLGKGVCGTAAKEKRTFIVDDVNQFKGHIACSTLSKSEIVTPIIKDNIILGVIDIDSPIYNRFTELDKVLLENVAKELAKIW